MYRIFSIVLTGVAISSTSHAVCDQTVSAGANLASVIANAANGSTICLGAGSYGSVQILNVSKNPRVTLQSTTGRTASVVLDFYNGSGVDLKNLTIAGLQIRNLSKNITAQGNTFTGQTLINMGGNGGNYGNANILLDGNTFDGISVCENCYEGRIQVISNLPCGVKITNNHIGLMGEADGIQNGANGLEIGPGNIFEGIRQGNYKRHVDSIQLYGASNTKIIGNYFFDNDVVIMAPDGSENEVVTNNVMIGGGNYVPAVQFGSASNLTFTHNTVKNLNVHIDKKSDRPDTSENAVVMNNIMIGAYFNAPSASCTNCKVDRNLYSSSGASSGTNSVIGSPIFTGGASPANWAGYQLASASPGYRAGTDGQDLGSNYFGSTITAPPPAVRLGAPKNLRIVTGNGT